jgi:AmmeMemoRadiSam system protein A
MAERSGDQSLQVRIAWFAIESYVWNGVIPPPHMDDPMIRDKAGCFVSLKKKGELRGCIGTISPTTGSIEEEIIRNAVAACSQDPRFDPVEPQELADLEVSVDILGIPEPIASEADLDPDKFGVIVTSGFKRGLLLPDLEGVDTAEKQIAIACRKAGIDPLHEDYHLQRFTVTRFH